MTSLEDIHCSVYCRENNIPIIATGRKKEDEEFGGYILVVYPHNWDAKIDLQEGLLSRLSNAILDFSTHKGVTFRLQAVRDDAERADSTIEIVIHRWNSSREQYLINEIEIDTIFPQLLASRNQEIEISSPYVRDILICTHSQRDLCCGRYGYPIYKSLIEYNTNSTLKIWRSSHITGHRAAPVILDLPAGNYWGYMIEEITKKVASTSALNKEEILYHFRGGTDLTPHQQLVDQQGFVQYGWTWFEHSPQIVEEDLGVSLKIKMSRGDHMIECEVIKQPGYIEIGETHCGYTKGPSIYTIVLD
ncbi:MAG: sucrase ferredoxin [Candidatus Kariarchaeaceae archaeon]